MDQNSENQFPSEYDEYYYYCRIMYIEEAKEDFIKCNELLLGDHEKDSIVESLLVDHSQEDKSVIYKRYKKLYDDYIRYSDILINKQDINTEDDYARVLKNLIRISNETTKFTYFHFLMKKNKLQKKKFIFKEENIKLSKIIEHNSRIFYLLNPNENIDIFMNKHSNGIIYSSILVLLLIGLSLPLSILNINNKESIINNPTMIFSIVLSATLVLFGISLFVIKLIYNRKLKYIQIKGDIDSKNDKLILHIFKNKIKFSTILKSINTIIETLKNIKELR